MFPVHYQDTENNKWNHQKVVGETYGSDSESSGSSHPVVPFFFLLGSGQKVNREQTKEYPRDGRQYLGLKKSKWRVGEAEAGGYKACSLAVDYLANAIDEHHRANTHAKLHNIDS
ncbi:MAG: hypothetical protein OEU80_14865 [Deltaproteobacteria bacterium]|nr:hypothetical protein [Deltaproteobacteria bacterium]